MIVCPHCHVAFDSDDASNVVPMKAHKASLQPEELTDSIRRIDSAQRWYCRAVGIVEISPNMAEEHYWQQFFAAGFTEQDLESVIRYLKARIRDKRRNEGSILLRNILNPTQFREDLTQSSMNLKLSTPALSMENRNNQPSTVEEFYAARPDLRKEP